jgi:MFS transporter, AAHS family, 4-hydroxybenzoate transporter
MRQRIESEEEYEAINRTKSIDKVSYGSSNAVDLINSIDMSLYQKAVFFLCFLVLATDGFDAGAIGYVAPSLVTNWGISRAVLGPVMSASLIGLGLGAVVAGPMGDKIGRKAMLVASVGSFGVFSLAAAHADSAGILAIMRFFTGIGLGAAMPNALTLTSEYSPSRLRAVTVNIMNCGYSFGLVVGGIASAWLIPHLGWRIVLVLGGIGPMILALLLGFLLPESIEFLATRGNRATTIAKIVARISPGACVDGRQTAVQSSKTTSEKQQAPFKLLFAPRYHMGTLMLWLAYFMGLLIYYLLVNWLPTLMRDAGFSVKDASWMTSMFPLGGMLGTVCVGWLMDRTDGARVIAATYGLTALLVAVAGSAIGHQSGIGVLLFICGALLISAPTAMSALAVIFYPTQCRATGVSWMHGVGRLGGVAGASVGAVLMSTGWNLGAIFALLAVPALVAGAAIYIIARSRLRQGAL